MLSIRLQRIGRRNDPVFRVVVTEKTRGPKSGKHVELLGSYNPRQKRIQLKSDRIKHWISVGAEVSPTVHNLLIREKVIEGKKINVLPRKSPIVKSDSSEESSKEVAKEADSEANKGGGEGAEEASQKTEKTFASEGTNNGESEEDSEKVVDGAPATNTEGTSKEKTEEKSEKEEAVTPSEENKE